jgi:NADH-quinone oxidoreductase subunit C
MATKLETLAAALSAAAGDALKSVVTDRGEVTIVVPADGLVGLMRDLRDRPELRFEMLIDVCGADYSAFGNGAWEGARFAAVYHLLSLAHNWRLRVRVFAPDDDFPGDAERHRRLAGANWFEREAFDLYGIVFEGIRTCAPAHRLRLRRPSVPQGLPALGLRRDALRPRAGAVIYQPVTIEPREITPRDHSRGRTTRTTGRRR